MLVDAALHQASGKTDMGEHACRRHPDNDRGVS
jgi:hypothetical protein